MVPSTSGGCEGALIMWLNDKNFRCVLSLTPLFSMDLLVRRPDQTILLGLRRNRPAKGFWFVPGGRVYKDEPLDNAFKRLTQTELGMAMPRSKAQLLGLYEHFYTDSVFGDSPSTHYVVAAYILDMAIGELPSSPADQHHEYRWWSLSELDGDVSVHPFIRDYIKDL